MKVERIKSNRTIPLIYGKQTRAEPRGVQQQAFENVKYPSTMQNVGM